MIEHYPTNDSQWLAEAVSDASFSTANNESYQEHLAPFGSVELNAADYTAQASEVSAIFDWFDDASLRALEIHDSTHSSDASLNIFSILPIKKLGEVHAIKPHEGYLERLDERRHRAKSYAGEYSVVHTDYWTELAVAMQDRNLIDEQLVKVVDVVDEDERYGHEYEHSPELFRRNLLNYAKLVEGLARLGEFNDLDTHFDRLDRYWQGAENERYFDWLNQDDQVINAVGDKFVRPPRQSLVRFNVADFEDQITGRPQEQASRSEQILDEETDDGPDTQTAVQTEDQEKLRRLKTNQQFFDLLDSARSRWIQSRFDDYVRDDNLTGEHINLGTTEIKMDWSDNPELAGIISRTVSERLFNQINLVTDLTAQRRLHYQLFWLQPPERKAEYAKHSAVEALFSYRPESASRWQPYLLRQELGMDDSITIYQRERIKTRIGKSEFIVVPDALQRLLEQVELNPGPGPLRQLTDYVLRPDNDNVRHGGLEALQLSERFLPQWRALGEFGFSDIVTCFDKLAQAAANQKQHSVMLRFMFETAVLTGQEADYSAYLKAESEYQSEIKLGDSQALKRRSVQYAFDWTDYFKAESEYRKQKDILAADERITYGLCLLRLAINHGYQAEKAAGIVAEVNEAYALLDSNAKTDQARHQLRQFRPLKIYREITTPSPRQTLID